MNGHRLVLSIDIGGTRTKYGVIDLDSRSILVQQTLPTDAGGQTVLVQTAAYTARSMCKQTGLRMDKLTGAGVGVPGYVDGDEISQVWQTIAFIEGHTFRAELETALGLPVRMDNDARIIALGETYFGGHDGVADGRPIPSRLLSLTLGTGLGVSLAVDGRLQERSSATHLAGHIPIRLGSAPCFCGFEGCLESLVGGASLPRNYQQALNEFNLQPKVELTDGRKIFELASIGSPAALQAVRQMLDNLIVGLNAYIYLYAPSVIVLGGGTGSSLGPWLDDIRQGLFARPYDGYQVIVNISQLGARAGLFGAGSLWE